MPRWVQIAMCTLTAANLTACSSTSAANEPETPAVLEESNATTRAELSAAVSTMLKGVQVTLPEDALMHDSWLTVERVQPRDAKGRQLNGRVLERPEQFQLIKQQGRCVLLHQGSGQRQVLSSVGCRIALAP